MKTVANDIIQRYDYAQVISNMNKPISVEKYANNPTYAFLNVCDRYKVLSLPILTKIVNK